MTTYERATDAIQSYQYDGTDKKSVFATAKYKVGFHVFHDYDTAAIFALLSKYREINKASHALEMVCDLIGLKKQ